MLKYFEQNETILNCTKKKLILEGTNILLSNLKYEFGELM